MLFFCDKLGMSENNVKTLLLLNSSPTDSSFSFLFHCARYWAHQGDRVLFISKAPVRCLPLAIGKTDPAFNPDEFKLIQFMYLATWQELLHQLYSIHLRHKPVSVIIIKNLEIYLEESAEAESHLDHVSLICASLLYAGSVSAKLTSKQTILINEYISEDSTIVKNIVKTFFPNVWRIESEEENSVINFVKVSHADANEFVNFKFNKNFEQLKLTEVIQKIIDNS